MKILQLVPGEGYADYLWDDVFGISRFFRDRGYSNEIYTDHMHRDFAEKGIQPLSDLPKLTREDVIIYHKCADTVLSVDINGMPCRKMIRFHGNLPARYWKSYSDARTEDAETSLRQLCELAETMDYAIPETRFQGSVLKTLHYRALITPCPPLFTFTEYATAPDADLLQRYQENHMYTFLFTGKFTPNQKVEDVLQIFACYVRYCDANARLFLAGDLRVAPGYVRRLRQYAAGLEIEEQVIFLQTTSIPETLSLYQMADMYIDMSEYAGFSAGLMESMYLGVPIIASDTQEHRDILGENGIFLSTEDTAVFPMEGALFMAHVLEQKSLRREISARQRRQQQQYTHAALRKQWEEGFTDFLENVPPKARQRRR